MTHRLHDTAIKHHQARMAYKRCGQIELDYHLARHFERGWRKGYFDVSQGADGRLPTLPPQPYWAVRYQNPEGQQLVQLWFDGYKAGALAAEQEGRRQWNYIPSSAAAMESEFDVRESLPYEEVVPLQVPAASEYRLPGPTPPPSPEPPPTTVPPPVPEPRSEQQTGQAVPGNRLGAAGNNPLSAAGTPDSGAREDHSPRIVFGGGASGDFGSNAPGIVPLPRRLPAITSLKFAQDDAVTTVSYEEPVSAAPPNHTLEARPNQTSEARPNQMPVVQTILSASTDMDIEQD